MSSTTISAKPVTTTLRLIEAGDAARFHLLINDWEICRLLPEAPFPYPAPLARDWIDAAMADRAAGRAYQFAITDEPGTDGTQAMIGCAGLRLDKSGENAALGYWVARRAWGRGHGRQAVLHLLRWGFAELGMHRVIATVADDNAASLAVLRRAGFTETGTGHEKFISRPGIRQAVRHFAITREDIAFRDAAPKPAAPANDTKPLLLVAACALIDKSGKILLARRPAGKKLAGLWEFPGGKLAPGETPEAALVRELDEELGITVRTADVAPFAFASHGYETFHLMMPLYLCRRWQGTPQSREGQALAWVDPTQLEEYPMPPADRPLIPLLRDFL
ncbi:MAG: GNAT family N-acetyltransferase [Acidiphilium sp. 37-64-53]|uniref:8-oxo-dGTP diphosphatase MutT n=1 Tax=Acidiphilium TaxID=522 RepID=UPI000BC4947F|nr:MULTISPECIES: 8-oxo-dGTP diphosphatase MutT [Acidiphilium]OYW04077.1 MAG: GNAT family N-acetyltransferase [Acidiphilium sp. 37-64-53]OZB29000.1 MAG: GNAT family N-acetyltransferase [Acidiphilium sp. 34-64-41]HQT83313.1 8-oxo-dGTP diphosphatase MutT [Acidiphilium rubrum]